MDIKVSKDCYVPKENIKFYVSYDLNWIKRDVRTKRKDTSRVIDLTNKRKILSVIYLKTGEILLVNTNLTTLRSRMEEKVPESYTKGS